MQIIYKLNNYTLGLWHNRLCLVFFIAGIFTASSTDLIKTTYSYFTELIVLWSIFNIMVFLKEKDFLEKQDYNSDVCRSRELISNYDNLIFKQYGSIFVLLLILIFNINTNITFQIYLALSLLSIFFLAFHIYKSIKFKKDIKYMLIGLGIFSLSVLHFNKSVYIDLYGNEIIGSYFEKPEYKTQYYINLFESSKSTKSYRLVAQIHVHNISYSFDGGDTLFGADIKTEYERVIELESINFPNGGYIYFEETYIEPNKLNKVTDQNSIVWYVELTNMKVEN